MGVLFWSALLRDRTLIYAAGFTRPLGSHNFASSPEIIDKFWNNWNKSHWIAKLSQQSLYLETGPEMFPSLCTGSTFFFHSSFCVLFIWVRQEASNEASLHACFVCVLSDSVSVKIPVRMPLSAALFSLPENPFTYKQASFAIQP